MLQIPILHSLFFKKILYFLGNVEFLCLQSGGWNISIDNCIEIEFFTCEDANVTFMVGDLEYVTEIPSHTCSEYYDDCTIETGRRCTEFNGAFDGRLMETCHEYGFENSSGWTISNISCVLDDIKNTVIRQKARYTIFFHHSME